MQTSDGNLITDPAGILKLERWEVYFNELLNSQLTEEVEAPSLQEEAPKKTVNRLKYHKAPGADGISAELIQHGGPYRPYELEK